MAVIDADTHVDESDDTWSLLAASERRYRPMTVSNAPEGADNRRRFWVVDGQLLLRHLRSDERTGTVPQTRDLSDIPARIRQMDELGVDVHTIYPTFFLSQPTNRPEVERALCRAYNRWIAERCAGSGGRLRWLAVLPTLDMGATLEEIRFARDHGACGVHKRGIEAGLRGAGDDYFLPLYKAASEAGLAVCFHLALADAAVNPVEVPNSFWLKSLPVLDACNQLVTCGIPKKLPELRVGFIEVGAAWVPYVMSELQSRHERLAWSQSFEFSADLFRASRFFVACQTQEDIPYLLKCGLEDCLVIGSDYSHGDMTSELNALGVMRGRVEKGVLDAGVARKMLQDNPARLYGIAP